MGAADMLRAWSAVLADRREDVLSVCGNEEDVIENIGTASDPQMHEPFVLKNQQLKGLSMLAFGLRYVWDLLTRRTIQTRIIYMPKAFIANLRQTAQEQLTS
ncbi:MAG: hypothetical protein Q9174_005774, partial [Haloplaca sp. 1 TL-2023]